MSPLAAHPSYPHANSRGQALKIRTPPPITLKLATSLFQSLPNLKNWLNFVRSELRNCPLGWWKGDGEREEEGISKNLSFSVSHPVFVITMAKIRNNAGTFHLRKVRVDQLLHLFPQGHTGPANSIDGTSNKFVALRNEYKNRARQKSPGSRGTKIVYLISLCCRT